MRRTWLTHCFATISLIVCWGGCAERLVEPFLPPGECYVISDFVNTWCPTEGNLEWVPTWNANDMALELTGAPTIMSTPWIEESLLRRISFLANRTGKATLEIWFDYLEADYRVPASNITPSPFDESGRATTDRREVSVKADNWEPVIVFPEPPEWADYIGVHIVKRGSGSALISRLMIEEAWMVIDDDDRHRLPWKIPGYNGGETCETNDDCVASVCAEVPATVEEGEATRVCSTCDSDDQCTGISICGFEVDHRACAVPDAKPLGERCAVNEECADGICCLGVCSACCEVEDCEAPRACTRVLETDPMQCAPGEGLYAEDELCFRDQDCASSSCEGEENPDASIECTEGDVCLSPGKHYGFCGS